MKVGASHPPAFALFCNRETEPENISWSKKWAGPTAGSDRLVRIDSHRAIVHSQGLGEPESAINVVGLRGVWNTNFYKASVATEIAKFNSRCRYDNAEPVHGRCDVTTATPPDPHRHPSRAF